VSRRIAVLTTSRADYGLLFPLISLLHADARFELALIVTGSHLAEHHGMTVGEIERDGFPIVARVPLESGDDTGLGTARALGGAVSALAGALAEAAPDVAVVLGDRFEALAAAQAALVLGIPIAHIHGGEVTRGSLDDPFRHAITKMATVHFPAAEEYRRRIIQMGTQPSAVMNVGALAVVNVLGTPLLSPDEFAAEFGVECDASTLLVTFHPVTKGGDTLAEAEALIAALERVPQFRVLFTAPNADAGGRALAARLEDFVAGSGGRVALVASLGRVGYLSAARNAAAVVGNSSSGLIEVPALRVPSVDIGVRQEGRIRPESVVHAEADVASIVSAIERATSAEHRALAASSANPYGSGGTAARIADALADTALLEAARDAAFFAIDFQLPAEGRP